jgi:mannan endo-1,4-beta-mannosidase
VQGLDSNGDGVTVKVSVKEDGFYDIDVYSASMDGGYKENYVLVDGEQLGVVSVQGKAYTDAVLERAYMAKGEHSVTVKKFWGWIRIDKIKVKTSPELPAGLYDVKPDLVNPDASKNVRRLMTYLCDNYGKKVLSGQYSDGGMYGIENACIWKATGGTFPAILGLDMIDYSPSRQSFGSTSKTVEHALEYWDKGGIVTLCWHWNAPLQYLTGAWYKGFYTEYTNIDLAKVFDGRDKEGYALLLSDIGAIAKQLKRLCDADVPILWRPLHEASGGWFWWGSAGPEAYIKLYRLLYDELTNRYQLNNLIWVWNGQGKDWYPGDGYVDIIGEDIYPGEHVYTPQSARFIRAAQYTQERKMIVLSENGCLFDPDLALRDGAMWGWFCTWGGEFVLKSQAFNDISEKYTEAFMVQKVYAHDLIVTRSELPDLKNYPLREK